MINEKEIEWVYGETIFNRGMRYFEEGRAVSVTKFSGQLIGEIIGTGRYKTYFPHISNVLSSILHNAQKSNFLNTSTGISNNLRTNS